MSTAPRTLPDLLAEAARDGTREALGVCGEYGLRAWSAAELAATVERTAAWLESRGLRPGERVALWARTSPEWVAAFFALTARGATAVLIDREFTPEHARDLSRSAGCRALLHDGDGDDVERGAPPAWRLFDAVRDLPDGAARAARVDVRPHDPAAIIFTSGTTGEPRGVVLTHANLLAPLAPFRRWRRVLRRLRPRVLVLPPPSHAQGLVIGTLLPLSLGAVALHLPSPDVARLVRFARGHRIAAALVVPRVLDALRRTLLLSRRPGRPTLAERLERAGPFTRAALLVWHRGALLGRNRFRLLLTGGAALPHDAEAFWRRSGLLLVQGYGLAETAALATVGTLFGAGQVGRALPGVELRLDSTGEVHLRGPGLSPGALRPDGTFEPAPLDAGGFLPTGDLGRLDARGRLVLIGRRKEVIVTSEGHNVAPDEVEAALRARPGVRDCAVVARSAAHGEEVHALLVLDGGTDPAACVRAANAGLPEYARVRGFSLWEGELPRGALGKLRRGELRRQVEATRLPEARPEPTLAAALAEPERARRIDLLARLLATRPETLLDARVGLRDDLGLASLDVVELLAQAERERGAPPSALRPVRTGGVNPAVLPSGGLPPPGPPDKATLADIAAAFATVVPDARAHRLPSHQPPWSRWLPLRAARPPARALALGLWRLARADVRACWHADPGALRPPLFVVAAPHRHWLDAFALAAALPTRVRRRLLVVTNHDFGPWFAPRPGTPWREIVASAAGYFVGLPLLFEFAILTPDARARVGLTEIAGALDRGLCPLWFPHGLRFGPPQPQAPGLALLALETGHAILPAHVEVDHGAFGWRPRRPRPRVVVHFGSALWPGAGEPREALMARLDEALGALSERAPSCGFRSAATSPRSR